MAGNYKKGLCRGGKFFSKINLKNVTNAIISDLIIINRVAMKEMMAQKNTHKLFLNFKAVIWIMWRSEYTYTWKGVDYEIILIDFLCFDKAQAPTWQPIII